jgi:type II secretory pathway pseudopilin PulG
MPIIKLSVDMIQAIENGQTVEDAVQGAFAAMQQAQQQAQQAAAAQQQQAGQDQGGAPGGAPGGPPDGGGDGTPQGVAPGQAGLPPGGRPSLEQMISGFRGGGNVPVLQNEIRRSVPIGSQ